MNSLSRIGQANFCCLRSVRISITQDLKFDFSWFIPAIVKYRTFLGEVFLASFFLQLFALLTPLFTQVVVDKVLVHKGFTTLHVLAVGMVALASLMRRWVVSAPISFRTPPIGSMWGWAPNCFGTSWPSAGLFRIEACRRHGGAGA